MPYTLSQAILRLVSESERARHHPVLNVRRFSALVGDLEIPNKADTRFFGDSQTTWLSSTWRRSSQRLLRPQFPRLPRTGQPRYRTPRAVDHLYKSLRGRKGLDSELKRSFYRPFLSRPSLIDGFSRRGSVNSERHLDNRNGYTRGHAPARA